MLSRLHLSVNRKVSGVNVKVCYHVRKDGNSKEHDLQLPALRALLGEADFPAPGALPEVQAAQLGR
jgi:hypothetical protein